MDDATDVRLIEAGFPCHQVGAETQRERGASSALPPLYFLHVWWARRPLTPSRAAILASLLPSGTDPERFVRKLGIERAQALIQGEPWTLTGKLLERVTKHGDGEALRLDGVVRRALEAEQNRRAENRALIDKLKAKGPELANDPVLQRWETESQPLPMPWLAEGERLPVRRVMGDPAWASDKMAFAQANSVRFPGDAYGYSRAFATDVPYIRSGFTVIDPTAGGGSIPFEALRLGHQVIANELNPVATTILYATLDYPARFGPALTTQIEYWGNRLVTEAGEQNATVFADQQPLTEAEKRCLIATLGVGNQDLVDQFNREHIQDYLYARLVTCPHCGGEAPLLNTCWLSKDAADPWGVRVIPEQGKVRFETYRVVRGRGPRGEDPNAATVYRGVGQCVHCKQAIDGEEIKRQARGESSLSVIPPGNGGIQNAGTQAKSLPWLLGSGTPCRNDDSRHGPRTMGDSPARHQWQDRLYAVVAIRLEPKLDRHGRPERYSSRARKGEIKTRKIRYFRPPNERDIAALAEAERRLAAKWDAWDAVGLIPTERLPDGEKQKEPLRYGMTRWCDLFTPRQLLGHLTLIEGLNRLKPQILAELGAERGRAVVTYLQFAIDKGLDYNSRQTLWHAARGVIAHVFTRHDYSFKWTFGEMIFTGPHSGAAWGLSQVVDAYRGMAELLRPVFAATGGRPPVTIVNGTAAHLPGVEDGSVDLVVMDPPYYNNVQYAELSDFFYVWQRRALRDLYPGLYDRRFTDKKLEAVANPARDGSAAQAKAEYERLMGEIFRECRRVLKDGGIFTLMFTHKSQDAWETLTRSLIDAGWTISACFPVESEQLEGAHQKDKATAVSSLFLACRKRATEASGPAVWQGFGGQGVRHDIERAVRQGLEDFVPLKLNPVDEMVASYGRALQVLSAQWPVQDGDALVSPIQAMNEASRVVSQTRVSRLTRGKLKVEDLDSETALALTLFGIWECWDVAYDEVLNLSRALGIALVAKGGGYQAKSQEIGINTAEGTRTRRGDPTRYYAPLVRSGSKLRLALPEERQPPRLAEPQTDWDRLHGLIMAYREGDVPVARAYLQKYAKEHGERVRHLLEVWTAEARDPERQKEARAMLYGLGR